MVFSDRGQWDISAAFLPHQKILILAIVITGWGRRFRLALMCNSIACAKFNRDFQKMAIFQTSIPYWAHSFHYMGSETWQVLTSHELEQEPRAGLLSLPLLLKAKRSVAVGNKAEAARGIARAGWWASRRTRGFGGRAPNRRRPVNYIDFTKKVILGLPILRWVFIVFSIIDRELHKTVNKSNIAFSNSRWLAASCIVTYVPIF